MCVLAEGDLSPEVKIFFEKISASGKIPCPTSLIISLRVILFLRRDQKCTVFNGKNEILIRRELTDNCFVSDQKIQ